VPVSGRNRPQVPHSKCPRFDLPPPGVFPAPPLLFWWGPPFLVPKRPSPALEAARQIALGAVHVRGPVVPRGPSSPATKKGRPHDANGFFFFLSLRFFLLPLCRPEPGFLAGFKWIHKAAPIGPPSAGPGEKFFTGALLPAFFAPFL